ncbi:response regulator [Iodidimonas sp. SYSU 1G8]|uniref:hybrid sensor histidine kinase/response regulator n=1 Tax=Iodidimonas sp. SYSU 1G8 TaxID=3133967 RepID=UPI0031FEFEB3
MTDLQQELLAIFRDEVREHLSEIRRVLLAAREDGDADFIDAFRRAHSLKGAARAVDNPAIESLAHDLEALLSDAPATGAAAPGLAEMERLLDAIEGEAGDMARIAAPEAAPNDAAVEVPATEQSAGGVDYLRIPAAQVDRALHSMETLSQELQRRDRAETALLQIQASLKSLDQRWRRARRAEESDAGAAFEHELLQLARDVGSAMRERRQGTWNLDQAAARLRDDIAELSLVPIESVFGGFGRMVRELARENDRDVTFRDRGFSLHADRRVLQALKDPLMHLLRNAVSHGAEGGAERRAAGKPETVSISVEAAANEGMLVLTVRDDGRGLDFDRIAAVAGEAGILPPQMDDAPALRREQLARLLFSPGFSTAGAVDRLSGRGMGLAIVHDTVRRLQGSIDIHPATPYGTQIVIAAPLVAARHNVLLVEAGPNIFALPMHPIESLLRLKTSDIHSMGGSAVVPVTLDGSEIIVPIVGLGALLNMGDKGIPAENGMVSAVLVRWGAYRCAFVVDRLIESRNAIVTDTAVLSSDPHLVNGSLLYDERPVLVLNPAELLARWGRSGRFAGAYETGLLDRVATPATPPTILVVDDSITTRTLEKSILESQGYRVILSMDGIDALSVLRGGTGIDLVITDIEMPRMDGFSLLQAMKNDADLATIPVILMTSRADPEDMRRGLDLGADSYITKQKFDQRELLSAITQLL